MALPQKRNQKKSRRRKFNPMAGRQPFRLDYEAPASGNIRISDTVLGSGPYRLEDRPRSLEDMLDETPTFEEWLEETEPDRLLMEPEPEIDEFDMDFDDNDWDI